MLPGPELFVHRPSEYRRARRSHTALVSDALFPGSCSWTFATRTLIQPLRLCLYARMLPRIRLFAIKGRPYGPAMAGGRPPRPRPVRAEPLQAEHAVRAGFPEPGRASASVSGTPAWVVRNARSAPPERTPTTAGRRDYPRRPTASRAPFGRRARPAQAPALDPAGTREIFGAGEVIGNP
jgi:hypothetical protein